MNWFLQLPEITLSMILLVANLLSIGASLTTFFFIYKITKEDKE